MAPVFLAIRYSVPEILLNILIHNPTKDKLYNGDTALHFAVRENKILHAQFLISFGYSVEAKNREDISPIQLAQNLKYYKILDQLEDTISRQRLQMLPKKAPGSRKVETFPIEAPKTNSPSIHQVKPISTENKLNQNIAITQEPIQKGDLFPNQTNQDFPHPVNSPTQAPAYVSTPVSQPVYFQNPYDSHILITRDEFAGLQKRVGMLEMILSTIMPRHNDKTLFQPQICFSCHSKPGLSICPVCGHSFCTNDWVVHVANGCH